MSGVRTGVILVKLGAVLIAIVALRSLSTLPVYILNAEQDVLVALFAIVPSIAIPLLVAALLWFFPSTLIGEPIPKDAVENDTSPYAFLAIGITLLGLYALVFGVLDLAHAFSMHIWEKSVHESRNASPFQVQFHIIARYITSLLQIVFGVLLVTGRSGLADALSKIRRLGVNAS